MANDKNKSKTSAHPAGTAAAAPRGTQDDDRNAPFRMVGAAMGLIGALGATYDVLQALSGHDVSTAWVVYATGWGSILVIGYGIGRLIGSVYNKLARSD